MTTKNFKNRKHFLSLVTRCAEVRVKLLSHNHAGVPGFWATADKAEIKLIEKRQLPHIQYRLHTHLVPKGGILYLDEINN